MAKDTVSQLISNDKKTSLIAREKRKWQIAMRRYVLEGNPAVYYAPFFGLDIKEMRAWFETQFTDGAGWDNFGKRWQFEHVVPVSLFDPESEAALSLAWNFTNLRVQILDSTRKRQNGFDLTEAVSYFTALKQVSAYPVIEKMLYFLSTLGKTEQDVPVKQQDFLTKHADKLSALSHFSSYAFELLNSGRSIEDIEKEVALLQNIMR